VGCLDRVGNNNKIGLYIYIYESFRLSVIVLAIKNWARLRTMTSLFKHVFILLNFVFEKVMYKGLLICFMPIYPAPLGAPSGGSKI